MKYYKKKNTVIIKDIEKKIKSNKKLIPTKILHKE